MKIKLSIDKVRKNGDVEIRPSVDYGKKGHPIDQDGPNRFLYAAGDVMEINIDEDKDITVETKRGIDLTCFRSLSRKYNVEMDHLLNKAKDGFSEAKKLSSVKRAIRDLLSDNRLSKEDIDNLISDLEGVKSFIGTEWEDDNPATPDEAFKWEELDFPTAPEDIKDNYEILVDEAE